MKRLHIIMLLVISSVGISIYTIKNPFGWIFEKIQTCSKIVPLAAKVTTGKASNETRKLFLRMAGKLEKLDPRLTSLAIAEQAARTALIAARETLKAAQVGLTITQKSIPGISRMGQALATFSGKGFNIQKAYFEGNAKDFTSPVVKLSFEGIIAGHQMKIPEIEFDLKMPTRTINNLLLPIVQKIWGTV